MRINYKILLVPFFLLSATTIVLAQTAKPSFTLTAPESGIRHYEALNFISLKPGFEYTAIPGSTFSAKINSSLSFNVVSISNPRPGDTSNSTNDPGYMPGGSFGTDPIQPLPPLSAVVPKIIHAGGTTTVVNDTTYTYPVLWFKTVPVTNNLNGEYRWKDVTTEPSQLRNYNPQGTGTEYKITRDKLRSYNFNPAIDLTFDGLTKEVKLEKSNLSQATIIGVWGGNDNVLTDKFMFAIKGRVKDSVLFSKSSLKHFDAELPNLNYGNSTTRNFLYRTGTVEGATMADSSRFNEKTLRVGTLYRSNKPNTSVWGESKQAVIALGGKMDATVMSNLGTAANPIQAMEGFKGYTPELIVFDRALSTTECSKYESYLALKYGLTLDKSYLSATNQIIWDLTANTNYNNRITGYGREDAMGLDQKMATTSYEEAPCYSKDSVNDSYDFNDSYRLSSRNRLLVVGFQQGNGVSDGNYVVFGDNNDLITPQSGVVPGFSAMSRKWMIQTNISPSTASEKDLGWIDSGIFRYGNASSFKLDIIKDGSTTTGYIVTSQKLKGKDGYFAWTVEQEYGPVTVKFGAQQSTLGTYDYGYQVDTIGGVHSIQKGIVSGSTLFTAEKGQRIEVEKHGLLMTLRINGIRYKNTEFLIDSIHSNMNFYGAISIAAHPYEVKLSNFRHGGFVDTGNRVELSYSTQRASGFANYKNKKAFLIIDRLNSGQPDTIRSDEYDEARSKIIFNNVFWDTDGNGKDIFTFGYLTNGTGGYVKQNKDDNQTNQELDGKNEIHVYYPDPRDQRSVRVKIESAKPTPAAIQLYDLSGRRVFTRNVSAISDHVQYVDVSLPTGGLYIITITTNEMKHTQKVVSRN